MGGTSTSNGRVGGPVPYGGPPPVATYSSGGRGAGSVPSSGNFNGYPPFQPPAGRFDMGRGGGGRMANGRFGGRRGDGGRGGGRGSAGGGFDSSRVGGRAGGSRGGGNRSFDGGRTGGLSRGGGRGGRYGASSKGDLDNIALPRQDFGNLVPFEKNFYVECPSVRAMSENEVKLYRSRREIIVEGHDVPRPIRMFEEANFPGTFFCL